MSDRKKKEDPLANAETILPSESPSDSTQHGEFSIDEARVDATQQHAQDAESEPGSSRKCSSDQTLQFSPPSATPPSEPPSNPQADLIAGFRIEEELGRGAFGVVYRAVDIKLDRQVAIKLPLLPDKRLAEKYIQEARNAAKIETGGVVPVYQVGTTNSGQPFVVQKMIDGTTLSAILKESGSLPVGRAVEYMLKVANAITGAHEAGLVHRDLKPANILVDRNNEPWVADFGLAVFEEEQQSLRGEIAGTPIYMSPEQLTGRADWLDGRTDIWALGIILYELIAGKPPFVGAQFRELKEQILNRHPRPLSQRRSDAPPELDEIFQKCCAKDISARYSSAHDMAADLEDLLLNTAMTYGDLPSLVMQDGAATMRTRRMATSTMGHSMLGRRTLQDTQRQSRNLWLPISVASVALISSLIGLALVFLRQPTGGDALTPTLVGPAGSASESPATRPSIRVSKTGDGTHTSITAALQAADEGDKIVIERGVYNESLLINKSVNMAGEGARDNVTIVGDNGPALTIDDHCRLALANLTIDAKGSDINTIEIIDGSLEISGCRVNTTSFDCVKVHPSAELLAVDCDFSSTENPAVVARQAKSLEFDRCRFEFQLPNLGIARDQPIVGVELTECGGTVKGCTFAGIDRLGKGISCRDAESKLTIAGCKFSDLLHGVEVFNCQSTDFVDLNMVSACQVGIYAEGSQGSMRDLEIKNCEYGLCLLSDSDFSLVNVTLQNNATLALRLQDSSADMEQCFVNENQAVGILVDDGRATDESSQSIALQGAACSLQANQIGLLLVAGSVRLETGLISQNESAGIAVISADQLGGALAGRARSNDTPCDLYAKRVRINAKSDAPGVLFNDVGSYLLEDCPFVDLPNNNQPALGGDFTTKSDGKLTRVVRRAAAQ